MTAVFCLNMHLVSYLKTSKVVTVETEVSDLGGNSIRNRLNPNGVLHTLMSELERLSSKKSIKDLMVFTVEQRLVFDFSNSPCALDASPRMIDEGRIINRRLPIKNIIDGGKQLMDACGTIVIR